MRILHVTHQYRPAIGGAEQYITRLSEALVERGHQVTVFTARSRDYRSWRSDLPPAEVLDDVEVRRFRSLVRGPRTWKVLQHGYRRYSQTRARRYEPLIFWGNGPVCPGLFWAMLRNAAAYDLVHINNLHYAHAATAYAAARWRGLPVVLTPHVHIEQPATHDVGYFQAMLRGCQHVIADTQAERSFLLESGLDGQRVTTAGVGIPLEPFAGLDGAASRRELGLPAGAFVLLFLGRKTEYKGLDVALEAFARLQGRYPALHFLAIGPETDHSQGLWDRRGDLPRLLRFDRVSDEVRLAALKACNCLVMPSTGEAFGIVYLEAWAAGRPVIGARTPAVASLVSDGRDGYLVPAGEAGQVAERLSRWLQDPALAQEMGRQGRQKVERRYTVPHITDIVEGVYFRTLRRHRRQNRDRAAG